MIPVLDPAMEEIMETEAERRVLTAAKIENITDLWAIKQGLREDVRAITVPDALVDTGATLLSMPTSLIRQLGLSRFSTKRVTKQLRSMRSRPL
jgi:hypothetical protein